MAKHIFCCRERLLYELSCLCFISGPTKTRDAKEPSPLSAATPAGGSLKYTLPFSALLGPSSFFCLDFRQLKTSSPRQEPESWNPNGSWLQEAEFLYGQEEGSVEVKETDTG